MLMELCETPPRCEKLSEPQFSRSVLRCYQKLGESTPEVRACSAYLSFRESDAMLIKTQRITSEDAARLMRCY
jgi:hypothetical protein